MLLEGIDTEGTEQEKNRKPASDQRNIIHRDHWWIRIYHRRAWKNGAEKKSLNHDHQTIKQQENKVGAVSLLAHWSLINK